MDDDASRSPHLHLDAWLELVSRMLGTQVLMISHDERELILDLAGISARRCERVAAPITTFLVGTALAASDSAERAVWLRQLADALGATEGS